MGLPCVILPKSTYIWYDITIRFTNQNRGYMQLCIRDMAWCTPISKFKIPKIKINAMLALIRVYIQAFQRNTMYILKRNDIEYLISYWEETLVNLASLISQRLFDIGWSVIGASRPRSLLNIPRISQIIPQNRVSNLPV